MKAKQSALRRGVLALLQVGTCALLLTGSGMLAQTASAHGGSGWGWGREKANANNYVKAVNTRDNTTVVSGRFKLYPLLRGDTVNMNDEAYSYASCSNCNSLAVALQVAVVSENDLHALNMNAQSINVAYECTTCVTEALAYQVAVVTPNPRMLPWRVWMLDWQLNWELRMMSHDRDITLSQAQTMINHVLDQYGDLVARVIVSQKTNEGATPDAPAPNQVGRGDPATVMTH